MSDQTAINACQAAVIALAGVERGFSKSLQEKCQSHAVAVKAVAHSSPCAKIPFGRGTLAALTSTFVGPERARLLRVLQGKSAGPAPRQCRVSMALHTSALAQIKTDLGPGGDPDQVVVAVRKGRIAPAVLLDAMLTYPMPHTAELSDQVQPLLWNIGPVGTQIMRIVMRHGFRSGENRYMMARALIRKERDAEAMTFLHAVAMRRQLSDAPHTTGFFPDCYMALGILMETLLHGTAERVADILVNAPMFNDPLFEMPNVHKEGHRLQRIQLEAFLTDSEGVPSVRKALLQLHAADAKDPIYTKVHGLLAQLAKTSEIRMTRTGATQLITTLPTPN